MSDAATPPPPDPAGDPNSIDERDDSRIAEAEYVREWGRDDDWQIGQDRYEKWLERWGS